MENSRNLLLAFVLSGLLIFGWDIGMGYFYPQPETPEATSSQAANAPGGKTEAASSSGSASGAGAASDSGSASTGNTAEPVPTGPVKLETALASKTRVKIDAPKIAGSINLMGGQIDDIVLKDYKQTVDKESGPVRLFAPRQTADEYFAEFGFLADGKRVPSSSLWEADGPKLTPDTPVTLTRQQGNLTLSIKFAIDDEYMISAEQSITNNAEEGAAIVQPFSIIQRSAIPGANSTPDEVIVHAGPIAVSGAKLQDPHAYHELDELSEKEWTPDGDINWLGFSDRYWLGALVPAKDAEDGTFYPLGDQRYSAEVRYPATTLAAGASVSQTTQLFAGAKESELLDAYEASGIALFGKAISWGWFEIIEKPLLWLLRTLHGLVGNFGVAIICLTLVIRGLMFPIAQKQFASMAQMKAVQPKMKAIQERYKDDKQTQQQKIMELYKEEKVNPLAGCLPLLIQIPIFFALYKVLILAIDMRHEPFLYINDLTAPDPATILNLFGLLPFEVPGFLGIGILAVLLGVTMWLTFKMNPTQMDPMQQQIFNLMPWFLMFIMATFASGLLIYWVTSNILTLAQQKYLYSQHPQLRAQAEKEKAEKAQKVEREKAEKGKA